VFEPECGHWQMSARGRWRKWLYVSYIIPMNALLVSDSSTGRFAGRGSEASHGLGSIAYGSRCSPAVRVISMNAKRLTLPLTIIGLLLAVAVILFSRSVRRQSIATPAILRLETKAISSSGLASHPVALTPGPPVDSHPRTWRPSPVDAYRNSDRAGHA
jgi:hypothetical protein